MYEQLLAHLNLQQKALELLTSLDVQTLYLGLVWQPGIRPFDIAPLTWPTPQQPLNEFFSHFGVEMKYESHTAAEIKLINSHVSHGVNDRGPFLCPALHHIFQGARLQGLLLNQQRRILAATAFELL